MNIVWHLSARSTTANKYLTTIKQHYVKLIKILVLSLFYQNAKGQTQTQASYNV